VGHEAERIADDARASGRPVAVALTVDPEDRVRLSNSWKVIGLVAVDNRAGSVRDSLRQDTSEVIGVDTPAVRSVFARVESWRGGRWPRPQPDPVSDYFAHVLTCPKLLLSPPSPARRASLDSLCNLR